MAHRGAGNADDRARAMKACLGNPELEHLVPSLFMAPLTSMQRETMITVWLVPCALALDGAKLAHRMKLVMHVAMHVCHGAIAVCHTLGSIISWSGFAIIGVALAATASTLVGLQNWVADAKHLQSVGDELMHVGMTFFSTLPKEVSEEQWAALVEELLAAKKGGTKPKTAPRALTTTAAPKGTPATIAATTKIEVEA